jgi:hypothetical protein
VNGDEKLVNHVKMDFETAEISARLKALLAIAGKVQRGGNKSQQMTSRVPFNKGH